MNRSTSNFVVLSGCSSGGKSTLLSELASRGYATVDEPGRRVVRQELGGAGLAVPWVDAAAFCHRVLALAVADLKSAGTLGDWVFFDRGLVDAAVAQAYVTRQRLATYRGLRCYHRRVFLVPPWPEIYVSDAERRHSFEDAEAEYLRLAGAYQELGYTVTVLPKVAVAERADLVVAILADELTD